MGSLCRAVPKALLPLPDRRGNLKPIVHHILSAAAGAGVMLSRPAAGEGTGKGDDLHVAIIGAGTQGRVLINCCLKIPHVRFKAVCDIWSYSQRYASRLLKKFGHEVEVYADYREMLSAQKDLDAVIVATPDWMHAEHAIACLKAGRHVYCEKEMSNSLAEAKRMVLAARQTGKLLQIGHQRRSNPRYRHAADRLIREGKLLGRITAAYGQWNRAKRGMLGWPKKYVLDGATLKKYGYGSMEQFRNWRWFRKYGGGPIVDLGSHQIDVFNWFLGANPKSVMASGGVDYYAGREWYDHVMAVYEFDTPPGVVRAFYQVLTTTSARGYYETFMGDEGTMQISEDPRKCRVFAEAHLIGPDGTHPWDKWAQKGYLVKLEAEEEEKKKDDQTDAILAMYGESKPPISWLMPVKVESTFHGPHLQNFFDAVRKGKPELLNCPAEVGYETAATVLRVNQAVEAAKRLDFKESDFKV